MLYSPLLTLILASGWILSHVGESASEIGKELAVNTAAEREAKSDGLDVEDWPPLDVPMGSDRPALTPAAEAVGLGRFQLEGGLSLVDESEARAYGFDGLLVRLGVSHRWELRVHTGSYRFAELGGADLDGLGDASLGLKVQWLEAQGARPAAAVLLETSLPTGSAAFSNDGLEPSMALLLGWSMGERRKLDLALRFDHVAASFPVQARNQRTASAALRFALAERGDGFLELIFQDSPHAPNHSRARAGVAFSWVPDLRVDLWADESLTKNQGATRFGSGLTVRF